MEKFNENLKFFLLLILILSALKKICVRGNVIAVPLEPLLTVYCNQLIIYSRKSRSWVKKFSKWYQTRFPWYDISCLLIFLLTSLILHYLLNYYYYKLLKFGGKNHCWPPKRKFGGPVPLVSTGSRPHEYIIV